MSLNKEKLVAFAQQVGKDYTTLNALIQQVKTSVEGKASSAEITQAVNALKNELLNGVGAEYDTFKEIAEKLTELASGTGVGEVLTQKLTEINTKLQELENLDLVDIYTKAKQGNVL